MFFDMHFLGTPINLCLSSQKCQGVLFPDLSKLLTFAAAAAAPLVLTPSVRNQVCNINARPRSIVYHNAALVPASPRTRPPPTLRSPRARAARFVAMVLRMCRVMASFQKFNLDKLAQPLGDLNFQRAF